MKGLKFILTVLALAILVSCTESHFHEDKVFAGGVVVTAKQLNEGKSLYTEYCMQCHGVNGDGNGVSSKGLTIPPRNFKLGVYKFGRVVSGDLPNDNDFYQILKRGLHGTAMLPWDLSDKQMFNVVQYIKTFAPTRWEGSDKKLGVQIASGLDPYGDAHRESAIQKGKEVYHIVAQCWTCHQAYISHAEFNQLSQKINNTPMTEFDPEMYHVKLQPSEYDYMIQPPEFTYDLVRSARTVDELYVRISSGVGGTSMASWKGVIQEDEIWAVAHYIRSLMDKRNTPERKKLFESMKN